MKIILGSQSKNRKKILESMGFDFEVMAAGIDEKAIRDPDPQKLVLLLANTKADSIIPKITEDAILITSDQVVVWNKQIREKPENSEQAREYLNTIFQYPPVTVTSVVVTSPRNAKRMQGVDVARVHFKPIPSEIVEKIVGKGQIFDNAGGFDIDEPLLEPYIEKIDGEVESILGLPKTLTLNLIEKVR